MMSSESGEDTMSSEGTEEPMKPVFLFSNPDYSVHSSHVGPTHPMGGVSYPYADPYYGGLVTAYGPPQAVMVGITPTRVPLPLDLADDGPIYVNAKQYHGILRRRQSRAKQEAQNRLIKQRKPYLHESRHRHALNRVRGSGGRFLSKKELQNQNHHLETSPSPTTASNGAIKKDLGEHAIHHVGFTEFVTTTTNTRSDATTTTNVPDNGRRFTSGPMCSGALLYSGTRHSASVVR